MNTTKTFLDLKEAWLQESRRASLMSDVVFLESYQKIIDMGDVVLPLLFNELKTRPDHWFYALHCITGANPVKPEHKGRLHRMAQDWVQWGKEHNYIH